MARWRSGAVYGVFDLVPVDLVDGPGDELVLVRIITVSAPPSGLELQLWKLGLTAPVALVDPIRVTGYLGTTEGAIPCARWRVRVLLDPLATKPRPIALAAEFAAYMNLSEPTFRACRLNSQGASGAAALRRGESLRFSDGRYRLSANLGTMADLLRRRD
jgi:hypothetical protein